MDSRAQDRQRSELAQKASALLGSGQAFAAEQLLAEALKHAPSDPTLRHLFAISAAQQGRFRQALGILDPILRERPKSAALRLDHGNILLAVGDMRGALADFETCLAIDPQYAQAWANRAAALRMLGNPVEALESLHKALALKPDYFDAIVQSALVLSALNRMAEAVSAYDRALTSKPKEPALWNNRGVTLWQAGHLDDAISSFDKSLSCNPDFPDALTNRGLVKMEKGRNEEAIRDFDRILELTPDHADSLLHKGTALRELRELPAAASCLARFVEKKPDLPAGWTNFGIVLHEVGRHADALQKYDTALALEPDNVLALCNKAVTLWELGRFQEALQAYQRVLKIAPDNQQAFRGLTHAALHLCDWDLADSLKPEVEARTKAGRSNVLPFVFLGYSDDPSLQFQCARNFKDSLKIASPRLSPRDGYRHEKVRIAYVSADFRIHPMTTCISSVLEKHDRDRFEVFAISLGPDDGSPQRRRIEKGVDRFIDAKASSDQASANLIRELEIDIAIDLNGYTQDGRPGVLARRPAPVQIGYMGYPGTSGAEWIDYLIADETVIPRDAQNFYSEKIIYIPDTYWVTAYEDVSPRPMSRAEAGLPEDRFVFACFNNNWKITSQIFQKWVRLLDLIPDSILWLLDANPIARANIQRAAVAMGLDVGRIVFAPRADLDAHFSRIPLADLFLDTLPYNSHTSACDALWCGVPLVTCRGKSFAARVAASILEAADLGQLVAPTLEKYEELALSLAENRAALQALRGRLTESRAELVLFDSLRFTRQVENAYLDILSRTSSHGG
jgi:predicted O-linked N-acetylglucosamine transferase (SPINDLY family)